MLKAEFFTHSLLIEVSVETNPSESEAKVRASVEVLVNPLDIGAEGINAGMLEGKSTNAQSLVPIYDGIRRRLSLGVARRLLLKNRVGHSTWLQFNKQAAYVGIVAICENADESPLGPIVVKFTSPELDSFIDWFAPEIESSSR
ncbi:MAG: hypothetical protein HY619_01715 [Thaumarchaeota archaeon]|nr:hypothetical protein [Nitrososphaerota archaeon]